MRHIWSFTSVMKPGGIDRDQAVDRALDQAAQIVLLFAQLLFQTDAIRNIAGGGEDAAHVAQGIAEDRCVERDLQQPPGAGDERERILGDHAGFKRLLDSRRWRAPAR